MSTSCYFCPIPATHLMSVHSHSSDTVTRYVCEEHKNGNAIPLPFAPAEGARPGPHHTLPAPGRVSESPLSARALRWSVHVDDRPHPIGTGEVLWVASRERGCVEVWTLEGRAPRTHAAQVFATGQVLPHGATHVGSCFDGFSTRAVWHVFALE